jgi:hypothetical protein
MFSFVDSRGAIFLFAFATIVASTLDVVDCRSSVADEFASTIIELDKLPLIRPEFVRPADPNLLFYIQNSINANTVVYTARIEANGQLDLDQPIDVYWRRFASGGARAPLSFLERIFAYGIRIHPQKTEDGKVSVNIVSYPQRMITIDFDNQAQPRATIRMGDHRAKLIYVYLEVVESKLFPSVIHVDVFGLDIENARVLHEIIKPLTALN